MYVMIIQTVLIQASIILGFTMDWFYRFQMYSDRGIHVCDDNTGCPYS